MTNINKRNQRILSIPNKVWRKIAQIDELKGQWTASSTLNPYALKRLKQSVLITSTGASTRIEGSKLSDEAIKNMLKGLSIQNFRDRDKQEVQGYYKLLENIFHSWKSLNFTENTIKHFHQELLKYSTKDALHRGEYKKCENKVYMINEAGESLGILFDTTPAYLTPKTMQELIEWTETNLKSQAHHPLLIVANFLVEFLAIHPFQDGNGRLSRILTNFLLLKAGFLYVRYVSHEKLIEDNKPEYYLALRTSQKTFQTKNEDIISWLDFFTKILLSQAQMAIELLSKENIENLLSQKQLTIWEYLQTVREASAGEITQKTGILRPTVNQTLAKLLQLKKIEKLGLGRSTRYTVITKLL